MRINLCKLFELRQDWEGCHNSNAGVGFSTHSNLKLTVELKYDKYGTLSIQFIVRL